MNRPFNLSEALAGKPVVNGHGEKVMNITKFPVNAVYTIYGVLHANNETSVESYTAEGVFVISNPNSSSNLFMVDPVDKRTGYVNIWQNSDNYPPVYANFHYSLEQAEAERTSSCSNKKKVLLARLSFEYTFNQDTKEIKIKT